jgi:hypothetical protein
MEVRGAVATPRITRSYLFSDPTLLYTYTDLVVFNKPPNLWIDGEHEFTLKKYIEQADAFKYLFELSQDEKERLQRKQVIAKRRVFFPHQVSISILRTSLSSLTSSSL